VLVLVVKLMVLSPSCSICSLTIWSGRVPSSDSPIALSAWLNTIFAVTAALGRPS